MKIYKRQEKTFTAIFKEEDVKKDKVRPIQIASRNGYRWC